MHIMFATLLRARTFCMHPFNVLCWLQVSALVGPVGHWWFSALATSKAALWIQVGQVGCILPASSPT